MVNNGVTIKKDRLTKICLTAYEAYEAEQGIFKNSRKYLPQWNIPKELEYSPQRTEISNSSQATKYLWTLALLENRTLSRINMRNGLATWEDKDSRWIFEPVKVVERGYKEVSQLISEKLQYTLNNFPLKYLQNAKKLIELYDGDPRKIIEGKSVEQAKKELMEFRGVGTGISNLFIMYLLDRKIASPLDIENCLLKIDVHKSRIPLNTEGIVIEDDEVREGKLVTPLENIYREICDEKNLNAPTLDSAFWIIGSNGCAKKDYNVCKALCPLEEMCVADTPLNRESSRFVVYERDSTGKRVRVDTRKNNFGQQYFSFFSEFETKESIN